MFSPLSESALNEFISRSGDGVLACNGPEGKAVKAVRFSLEGNAREYGEDFAAKIAFVRADTFIEVWVNGRCVGALDVQHSIAQFIVEDPQTEDEAGAYIRFLPDSFEIMLEERSFSVPVRDAGAVFYRPVGGVDQ